MSARPPSGSHGPSSIGDPQQPSLSLRQVHDDDALLDLLAAREGAPADPARGAEADPTAGLLAALAADVDRDLPTGVDELATRALAAALAEQAAEHEGPSATVTPLAATSRLAADHGSARVLRPSRLLIARRGMSVAVAASVLVGSASVAAALTQDPVGAFGVRAISRLVNGGPDEISKSELSRRLQVLAQQPTAPDPTEIAVLRQQASRLPDFGGPQVQQQLDSLEARITSTPSSTAASSTGGATTTASPSSPAAATPSTTVARPSSTTVPVAPAPVVKEPSPSTTDPTNLPTAAPTSPATPKPSAQPTTSPSSPTATTPSTGTPTSTPTSTPTRTPSSTPTSTATTSPTTAPSAAPTDGPTAKAPDAPASTSGDQSGVAPGGLPTEAGVLEQATATTEAAVGAAAVSAQ